MRHLPHAFALAATLTAFVLGGCTDSSRDANAVSPAADETATTAKAFGSIERLDPAFDALVPADARMEVIAEGFDWLEGPLWVPEKAGGPFLLFSDIPPNRVLKWEPGKGVSTYLAQSGWLGPVPRPDSTPPDEPGSNGLLLDPLGRLVLCQHGLRQVARMDAPLGAPEPRFIAVARHYAGDRFNSPNDGAFLANGDLYFTDPPYGLARKMEDPEKKLDYQGVFRVAKDGLVTLLTKSMSRPNGLAFAPDGKTLYVANSDPERAVWMAFPVKDDGTLGEGRVFFDAAAWVGKRKGMPDGLKVDRQGNLFATGPGGVLVFDKNGKHLGTLLTGQATSNCAFGDDGRTLYITADSYVLRIRLNTFGAGF
jgi:gluconolactonase